MASHLVNTGWDRMELFGDYPICDENRVNGNRPLAAWPPPWRLASWNAGAGAVDCGYAETRGWHGKTRRSYEA
jgi:hypothetical protein